MTEAKRHVARLLACAMEWSRCGEYGMARRLFNAARVAKGRLRKQCDLLDIAFTAVLCGLFAAHPTAVWP